jgi:uracil-DNA glycosylase
MADYTEIFGKDWARILKQFLLSDEWKAIRSEIARMAKNKEEFYPGVDSIFRAFEECPYGEMSTVILTTNPYDVQNDGLAFSCKTADFSDKCPSALEKILDGIEEDVCNGLYLNRESDLWRWADQGVLLLNADLTTLKGKPGAHLKRWHPFIKYVIKTIATYNTGICYILIGKFAHKFAQYINPKNNDIFLLEHPMVAIEEKRKWKHENVFSRVSAITNLLNNRSIDWTKNTKKWETGI